MHPNEEEKKIATAIFKKRIDSFRINVDGLTDDIAEALATQREKFLKAMEQGAKEAIESAQGTTLRLCARDFLDRQYKAIESALSKNK